MTFYWLMFLTPFAAMLLSKNFGRIPNQASWYGFGLFLVLAIGLRDKVGGDWINYKNNLAIILALPISELFSTKQEPLYAIFSYLSAHLGMDVYGVNLVCGLLFTIGLLELCKQQPSPWLGVLVSIPYLVIVVGMGYTRQGAAMGLLMLGLVELGKGSLKKYLIYILLAGAFHKTVLVFVAIAMLRPGSGAVKRLLGIGLLFGLLGGVFLMEQVDTLYLHYVEQTMESEGGMIRVLMNFLPSVLLFAFWRPWGKCYSDRWIWALFAILSIVGMLLVSKASTAVDRMVLYLIPLQIVFWSRFPELSSRYISKQVAHLGVVAGYALVMFVWLVYAVNSIFWIPYGNILFPEF